VTTLHTPRLRLEPLDDRHLEGLFAMNRQPEVMRYLGGQPETREQSARMIEVVKERWAEFGYSWWAFIELTTGELIGAGCIQHLGRDRANPLEIGWRLRPDRWKQGFAIEAARRMAAFAFDELRAPLLRSVCHPDNPASASVMQRLGMDYCGLEQWYDMPVAAYEMTQVAWREHAAPSLTTGASPSGAQS
jgi:RimJ/RimL family protein N-acetyltransferase